LAAGGGVSHTLIVRDVSERRRVEEALRTQAVSLAGTTAKLTALNAELQRRQAELQHAMSARNRFYASMSHELRTPINAIIGYSTLLLDHIYGPLTDRQRQGLERSHRAANHLLELVNDVLDLSKIEAGKIELTLQPVAFPAIIEELFVTIGPLADEHGSQLSLESDCEVTLFTDPRRVRQILLNLLSNAIKFGHGKPIEVRCSAGANGAEGGLEVAVRDHGAGISEGDLARIFDEFVQLPDTTPRLQGTGLGLSISKRLAQLLGGDLSVESRVGDGSTFRLTLPASVPATAGGSAAEGDAPAGNASAGSAPG
ncbi:MAG TPA: HAMP domain-containing sensor histidine kinase, partial [Gemmatimonadaceae bacterium]|nr:HAMP domain-containing sensor histidine kinase [Gemmatimonadaceae bacterium]